ncbi:ComEC/Rec2 family competence protein [Formosa sp. L2A11]|uniref:ComEC/Rec2 family competence protein n=1 Tax=Formosa sp. L2A11 TaxID=2686363 RepID=UPI00131EB18E|nr:ComEC/Rec2 family competence protein [Formosa sp. L2A11]
MKLSRFVIVKLTFFLILGICLGYFLNITLLWSIVTCLLLLCILFLILVLNTNRFQPPLSFGIVAFVLMISIGILSVNIHNQKLQKRHYSHFKLPVESVTFKIKSVLKSNTYYDKYVIDILKVNTKNVTGTSLLNIKKDTLSASYKIDDVFLTTDVFQDILPPLNPNQFNYKQYLERQYIYNQITTSKEHLLQLPKSKPSILGIAYATNRAISSKLKTYPFGSDELAILNALLLGQRQDISETLYTNYTKAGVIHILAVSGLHVGILLLILNYILTPFECIKHGKIIKTGCIIILMWCFALLTGLSPSVSRATLMFTLVAISLNSNRPSNIFNTVAISAFLLLLCKPMLLFDVGFQLSYTAVLSIITFQPKLNALWFPKTKLSKIFWNTLTVTTAAQIGVLPLSIYYFHQFPGLFFLSNLIIVPLLGYILGLGILIIALASVQLLPNALVYIFNETIAFMNGFISWIASQQHFIFDAISIKLNTLLAIYAVMLNLIYVYTNPKFKSISIALFTCIGLQITLIYNDVSLYNSEWVLFHKNRQTLLTYKDAITLNIYNSDSSNTSKSYPLKDYIISKDIKNQTNESLKSVYNIHHKTLLIVDSLGVYNVNTFKPYFVLLSNSPKVNLNRLIDSLSPKEIIADGSNYKSYIKRWEATCKHKKIPFYQTGKKGAYIFKE